MVIKKNMAKVQQRRNYSARINSATNRKRIINTHHDEIYPIFKFQAEEHAEAMLSNGNIHLSNIADFRDPQKYGGKTYDDREGQVKVYLENEQGEIEEGIEISLENVFIFCASTDFLSDSLKWAIDEKKTDCVLITDIEEVSKRITNQISDLEIL